MYLKRPIALIVCAVIEASCGRSEHGALEDNATGENMSNPSLVKRGLPGEPATLDPQLADDTFSLPVLRDLYEGLTSEDKSGHVSAGVAASWAISAAGTTYTFSLRPDARWSNGDPVTATDFVEGLRRAVDPKTASSASDLLSVVKGADEAIAGRRSPNQIGVRAPDEHTVEIELERPAPYLLQILSEPIAAPVHNRSTIPKSLNSAPVFDGAYTLSKRVLGSYLELAKNNYYWNSSHVAVDHIRYYTQQSESTELNRYLAGDLDLTSTIPTPDLDRIKREHASEVQIEPYLGTVYLALDLSQPPLDRDLGLRRALSMVVDREAIATKVIVGTTPAYNFVAAGTSGYVPASYEWATWSKEERWQFAKQLYKKAGYSDVDPLHLKVFFNSGEGVQRTILAITENWKEALGIIVDLKSTEFRVFLSEKKNKLNWDVLRTSWVADFDDPSSFLNVFSLTSPQNDPGYTDKSYEFELETAQHELDPPLRMAHFHEAEKLLLSDYGIIPLYFYTQRRLVNPKLGGAEITPLNHSRSQFLYWKN